MGSGMAFIISAPAAPGDTVVLAGGHGPSSPPRRHAGLEGSPAHAGPPLQRELPLGGRPRGSHHLAHHAAPAVGGALLKALPSPAGPGAAPAAAPRVLAG